MAADSRQKGRSRIERNAYATLITSDDFRPGVEVLLSSIVSTGTLHPTVVMYTEQVSRNQVEAMIKFAAGISKRITFRKVDAIGKGGGCDGAAHVQGWEVAAYTKLALWSLTEYERLVYIDADAVVLENVDELFDRPAFAAAPDVFPPDKFNAGVLVVKPDKNIFERMLDARKSLQSYDGGDTGFLNAFFSEWYTMPAEHRLPFSYNAQRTVHWLSFEKNPGYWNAIKPIKILHYSSSPKPWDATAKRGPLEMEWWMRYVAAVGPSAMMGHVTMS